MVAVAAVSLPLDKCWSFEEAAGSDGGGGDDDDSGSVVRFNSDSVLVGHMGFQKVLVAEFFFTYFTVGRIDCQMLIWFRMVRMTSVIAIHVVVNGIVAFFALFHFIVFIVIIVDIVLVFVIVFITIRLIIEWRRKKQTKNRHFWLSNRDPIQIE